MAPKKTEKKTEETSSLVPAKREIDSFTTEMLKDAEGSLGIIAEMVIKSPPEREFAANALKEFALRHDAVDAKRKSWVKPLKDVASDIDATFRPVLQAFKKGEGLLKEKIGAYDVRLAQERRRALEEASTAAQVGNEKEAEKAIAKAESFVVAQVEGGGTKLFWTGEVIDPAKIPREYLTPDVKKLEDMTKALGADPKIPGWRAFESATVRTSRKG